MASYKRKNRMRPLGHSARITGLDLTTLLAPLSRAALSSSELRYADLRTSISFVAWHCNEYIVSTRSRAARPIFRLRSRSAARLLRAEIHSFVPSAKDPVLPATKMDEFSPTGEATAGRPAAIYWITL